MEFYAVKALAALLKPPGLFAVLMAATALAARRRPRLARGLGLGSAALILLLSSGPVSDVLLDSLSRYPPVEPRQMSAVQAIVILGSGTQRDLADYGGGTVSPLALERLRYGARLARDSRLPVLVTDGALNGHRPGAQFMAEALLDWGVRARWIEGRALTTYDNARYARDMLAPEGIDRIALVSHAWHLPRAVAVFERVGFKVLPAPTLVPARRHEGVLDWLPDPMALERSVFALHEHLGRAWYRLRYGADR
ncbi:YdcF family protein [Immundisolibacter sp.]